MSYPSEVLADSPVGYWRLQETSGTAVADQQAAFPGTYVGGPTLAQVGPLLGGSNAVLFASGKYVDFGDVLDQVGTPFSVEIWFNNSSWGSSFSPLITKGDSGATDAWRLARNGTSNTAIQAAINGVGADATFPSTVDGKWHHVVFTYDGATIRAYADGSPSGTAAQAAGPVNNTFGLQIGRNAQQTGRIFTGLAAEAAVYSTVLTPARIRAHWIAAVATGYAAIVLADSPLGYWRLNDAVNATSVLDASGFGRNGTAVVGGTMPTFQTTGLLFADSDKAATFDGSSDRISIADNAAWDVATITVEALIKTTASGTAQTIIDRDDTSRVWQFGVDSSGHLKWTTVNGANPAVTSTAVVNDGNVHHVALTYDGSNYRLYIDGLADGVTASATAPKTTTSDLMGIGYRSQTGTEFFNGVLDEVAIYGTALSAARILIHAQAALAAVRLTIDSAPAVDTIARSAGIFTRAPPDSAPASDSIIHFHFQAVSLAESAPAVGVLVRGGLSRSRALFDSAHATDVLAVQPSHNLPAMTVDPSQSYGFNLGVGIELDPSDAAVAPGSRIHVRSETYAAPVLVDGRPT